LAKYLPHAEFYNQTNYCIGRNFLWIGNILRNKFALVAWKTVCLPKNEGGLGLFDIKARNKSIFSQTAMKHTLEI